MKKLIFLGIAIFLGVGAFFFKADMGNWMTDKKDQAVDMAIDRLSSRYNIPDNVKNDLKNYAKKIDPKMMLEFASNPAEFVSGKTDKAKDFMNSTEGKKIGEIYKNHMQK